MNARCGIGNDLLEYEIETRFETAILESKYELGRLVLENTPTMIVRFNITFMKSLRNLKTENEISE